MLLVITTSLADYESLALKLAHDPDLLASLKLKLKTNQSNSALFNTKRFTRHLEAAYTMMHQRHQARLLPDDLHVPATSVGDEQ